MASATQVFALSTGRSGSQTLADVLSRIPGCRVVHEQFPPLIQELTEFLAGRMSSSDLVKLLRETRNQEALGGTQLYGESNQRLSFVIPALSEAFPEAKYIWLVRDGRDSVSSFQHRYWYHHKEKQLRPGVVNSAIHRLRGDLVGDMNAEQWEALDSFGRCCWYWGFTQRVIARETERLKLPVFLLRLETLREQLSELLEFLNVDRAPPDVSRSNASRTGFLPALSGPVSYHWWSRRQIQQFVSWCGDPMDRLYPGWKAHLEPDRRHLLAGPFYRAARIAYSHLSLSTYPLRSRIPGLSRSYSP